MRACVRLCNRDGDGGEPTQPLAAHPDRFAAGDDFGGERAVFEGILVAASRPRAGRVFSAVRILLAGSMACAAFGKVIVPCALEGGTPSLGVVTLRCAARASRRCFAALLSMTRGASKGTTTKRTQFRLRQNAGRGSARKSKRLHGTHYTPARRSVDKSRRALLKA